MKTHPAVDTGPVEIIQLNRAIEEMFHLLRRDPNRQEDPTGEAAESVEAGDTHGRKTPKPAMLHSLISVFVAGSVAGLASFGLPLAGAVALAMMVSNVVSEFLRSKRVQEPMSWPRALIKGCVAGTIAFLVLSLLKPQWP